MTEKEKDELRNIMDNLYVDLNLHLVVLRIINEELRAFFTGEKSAEETAKIIQNRVGLYLKE